MKTAVRAETWEETALDFLPIRLIEWRAVGSLVLTDAVVNQRHIAQGGQR